MRITDIILESKESDLAKQYGKRLTDAAKKDRAWTGPKDDTLTPEMVGAELVNFDPSKRTLPSIFKWYTNGDMSIEDVGVYTEALKKFNNPKVQSKLRSMGKNDIGHYKNLSDLYAILAEVAATEDDLKSEEAQKNSDRFKDCDILINTPNFKVVIPKDYKAMARVGSGTKWCVAATTHGEGHFKSYRSDGLLYVIYVDDGSLKNRYCFHVERDECRDYVDRQVYELPSDIKKLSKHPEYAEFLNYLIDKYYGEIDF